MKKFIIILVPFLVIISLLLVINFNKLNYHQLNSNSAITINSPALIPPSATASPTPQVAPPIDQFKTRITKKFFGTYVTPQNSPVSPERFTGYHTGVDVEYGDVSADIPVFAIASGDVVTSQWVSGYGGVIVIRHQISGRTLYAVYGHLRPASLIPVGSLVDRGQQIAVLGTGYSTETDHERRHLHFGIATVNTLTGYVPSREMLHSTWIDPLSLY